MSKWVLAADFPRDMEEGDTTTMYWNNDLGFGALTNATVFTEEEAKVYGVPICDDEPTWVQLPPMEP